LYNIATKAINLQDKSWLETMKLIGDA